MHVSPRRTPRIQRRSLRGRAVMLGAALVLVTAQILPAAVLAAPNDGSIDASLRQATVTPGEAGVVDVAITCPDMGPAADGSEAIVAVVAAGHDGLSPITPIDETGTWSDGVLTAAIRFTAPAAPGSYDVVVRVAGRACVDGSSAAAAGSLTVEAPVADEPEPTPAPTDDPVPTEAPSEAPSDEPVPSDDPAPTEAPTDEPVPSAVPSDAPSTAVPSDAPAEAPIVAAAVQAITFDPSPTNARVGDAGLVQTATAMTAIAYTSLTPDVCAIHATTGALDLIDNGTCEIQADAPADATYEAAWATTTFSVWPAIRGCRSYTGQSYVGAVVLNPDGTPVGCGTTAGEGAPADLLPDSWAADWDSWYGPGNEVSFTQRLGYICDDCWIGAEGEDGDTGLPIGFPINFYGTEYTTTYVNSNGSIAFGEGSDAYDYPLDEILNGAAGVVAYGLDLDNREVDNVDSAWGSGRHGDFFYWGRTSFGGHAAFVATWMNILDYSANTSKTNWNTFQIMLVDIDDGAGTDVDIIVNYGSLQANDEGYGFGDGCYSEGGNCVAIGVGSVDGEVITYASIVDDDGILYNGKTSSDVADDGPFPLREAHLNNAVAGRFKFQMRDGDLPETAGPPGKPVITDAAKGDTTGTITWTEPANLGGSPVLSYEIQWRAVGDVAWSSDSPVSSPHQITGLTNGVTHEVQVSATNGTGTGPWSSSAYFTPGAAGSPEWDDTTVGALIQGEAFSGGVSATGTPAPTYAVTDGELPPGLSLDEATGAITGTPTQRGGFTFTITATNTVGSAEWVFTVSVAAMELPPTDTVGAPMPAQGGLNALALFLQVVVATVSVLAISMRLRPRDASPRV